MGPVFSNEAGNRREECLESWDIGSSEKGSGELIIDHGKFQGNRFVGKEDETGATEIGSLADPEENLEGSIESVPEDGELSDLGEEIEGEMGEAGYNGRQVTFGETEVRTFDESEEELQGKREECKRVYESF